MDDKTDNPSSMHDELIRITEAEILLLFDSDAYSYATIVHTIDVDEDIVSEALDNLVSKGFLRRSNHYYEVPESLERLVDCLKLRAITDSKLLRDGIKGVDEE